MNYDSKCNLHSSKSREVTDWLTAEKPRLQELQLNGGCCTTVIEFKVWQLTAHWGPHLLKVNPVTTVTAPSDSRSFLIDFIQTIARHQYSHTWTSCAGRGDPTLISHLLRRGSCRAARLGGPRVRLQQADIKPVQTPQPQIYSTAL